MTKTAEVTIVDKQYTGKMATKHRAACYAFGTFIMWLGKRIRDAKTYEELEEIGNSAEQRGKQLEEEYKEDMKFLGE